MGATTGEARAAGWRAAAAVAGLAAGVLAASWLKSDLANNDFERFEDLRLSFLFFALLGSACVGYGILALERRRVSPRVLADGWAAAILFLFAAFPVGSKDIFVYAFTGRIWGTYGANPLLTAPAAFPADPWQPYAQVIWAQQPSPYGPLFLWHTRIVDFLCDGDLFAAVWLHKLAAMLALGALLLVARRIAGPGDPRLLLIAWNPLLLFESAGNGHNDAFMALALTAAVWLHGRGGATRTVVAPFALALGIWTKWYAILFLPAFAIAAMRDGGKEQLRRWALGTAVIVAAMGALLLAPLPGGLPALIMRLAGHENLREVFPLQLSPVLRALLEVLNAIGVHAGTGGWLGFDTVRFALFAAAVATTLVLQWRGRVDLVRSLALLAIAFTMLAVTILWPWHLEVPVTLALLADSRRYQLAGVALTLLGVLSYFFTFAWAAVAIALVAAALFGVRRVSAARDSA